LTVASTVSRPKECRYSLDKRATGIKMVKIHRYRIKDSHL